MKRYLLLLAVLVLLMPVEGCAKKKGGKHVIGFYNVENLFDVLHDEGKNDYEYSRRYWPISRPKPACGTPCWVWRRWKTATSWKTC